jgi:hypothetical protein
VIAGALELQLYADVARLRKDFGDAKGEVASFAASAETILKGAATSIGAAFGTMLAGISFGAIVKAAEEAEKATLKLDAVVKATGSSAGYTRTQLDRLADSMAELTQFDDEAFRNASASILRFGNVSGQQFERTLKASADLAAFMGTDVPHAADLLARAIAAPAQGVERLQRTIGYMDEAQIKAIRTMVEMGDTVGAQNALLDIMEKRLGGVAETMNTGYTKALGDAKKAQNEFLEAIGKTDVVQGTTRSFLEFVSATFKDLKAIVEQGDWVEKTLRIFALAGGMRGVGNDLPSGVGAPGQMNEATAKAEAARIAAVMSGIDEQDQKLMKIALEHQKKAAEEAFRARVTNAEAELKADLMFLDDLKGAQDAQRAYELSEDKKLADDLEFIRKQQAEGEAEFEREKQEAIKLGNKFILDEERKTQLERMRLWSPLANMAADFFANLVLHGQDAFAHLRDQVKRLLAEMIALFAKRWILSLATGGSLLGSAASAFAGGAGAGSDASNALGLVGNAGSLLSTAGTAYGTYGGFMAGYASAGSEAALGAGFVGPSASLAGGSVGAGATAEGLMGSIGWTGWGIIIAAVVALVAHWLDSRTGGPKVGGSFFQGGAVPGTDNGRFFTPNQGDEQIKAIVEGTSKGFIDMFTKLGGTNAPGMKFGLGFDHDPNGSAQSRVSAMLTDAAGKILYNQHDLNMDDKEVPAALQLQAQRMILAALQASDLPKEIADILNSVTADTATSEQIQQAIAAAREMKAVMDALGHLEWGKLDVASLKAMALEGETISQTFQRIAGAMGAFDDAFLSDAQKFERASKHVTDVFASLGIAVPKTTAELVALVHGLDLSTAAGRNMFNMLMSVFPDLQLLFKPDAPDNFTTAVDHATNSVNDFSASLSNPARDLGDWLNKLIQDPNLTTLSLQQRYDQARRDVNSAFRLHDAGGIQSSGQQYLDLAKQLFGQGSPAYTAIFQSFYEQASKVGVGARPFQEAFNAALPAGGAKLASSADAAATNRILSAIAGRIQEGNEALVDEVRGLRRDVKGAGIKPFGT